MTKEGEFENRRKSAMGEHKEGYLHEKQKAEASELG